MVLHLFALDNCPEHCPDRLLSKVVSQLYKMAGFKGYFTNHSLRATAATQVFDADIDEQLDQNSKYRR